MFLRYSVFVFPTFLGDRKFRRSLRGDGGDLGNTTPVRSVWSVGELRPSLFTRNGRYTTDPEVKSISVTPLFRTPYFYVQAYGRDSL